MEHEIASSVALTSDDESMSINNDFKQPCEQPFKCHVSDSDDELLNHETIESKRNYKVLANADKLEKPQSPTPSTKS